MAEHVGLYIGNQSLDLVQVTGGFARPRVLKIGHVAVPARIPEGPEAVKMLTERLSTLLQQCRISTTKVGLGISTEAAIIRYFQMPKLPAHDRPTAIRFEAKKYLPFRLEELTADFRVTILRSDPQIMRVMYYAAKKDLVGRDLELCRAVGLTATSLETGLTGLTRALRRSHQLEPGKTAVVIAIDHETASIAILRDELIYLARNVSSVAADAPAGQGAVPALSSAPGAADPRGVYGALLNEAVVSVDYYRRRFLGEPSVTKVIVSGDAVPATWLRELHEALELPVEPADAGRGLAEGDRLTGNAAIAFGLALRTLDRPGAVNLLPSAAGQPSSSLLPLVLGEVSVAAIALVLLYLVQSRPVREVATQVAALQQPQTTLGLPPSELTIDRLQQLQAERHDRLRLLEQLLAPTRSAAAVLADVATTLPDTLWLRRIAYQTSPPAAPGPIKPRPPTLTLAGSAYSPDTARALDVINAYLNALNTRTALDHQLGTMALTRAQRRTLAQSLEITEFEMSNQGRDGAS